MSKYTDRTPAVLILNAPSKGTERTNYEYFHY